MTSSQKSPCAHDDNYAKPEGGDSWLIICATCGKELARIRATA